MQEIAMIAPQSAPAWGQMTRIGDVAREAREARGLSQAETARRSKMSQGAVSQIESGERERPDVESLVKLEVGLELEPGTLVRVALEDRGVATGPGPDDVARREAARAYIDRYLASERGRRQKLTKREIAWLRSVSVVTWAGAEPTEETIWFLVEGHRRVIRQKT